VSWRGKDPERQTSVPLHEERWDAAGKYTGVGWHTFRYTYRSWLDSTSAPIGGQQKLMRHAQVSTTMNVYEMS
jgi:integrase